MFITGGGGGRWYVGERDGECVWEMASPADVNPTLHYYLTFEQAPLKR